jgi:hypothetical protein
VVRRLPSHHQSSHKKNQNARAQEKRMMPASFFGARVSWTSGVSYNDVYDVTTCVLYVSFGGMERRGLGLGTSIVQGG